MGPLCEWFSECQSILPFLVKVELLILLVKHKMLPFFNYAILLELVIGGWRRELSAGQRDKCWRWYLLGFGKASNKVQEVVLTFLHTFRRLLIVLFKSKSSILNPHIQLFFSFDELLELSQRGDSRAIDMLVGDIYGGMDYSKV